MTISSAPQTPRVVVAMPSTGRVHQACLESVKAMMRATRTAEAVTFWWRNDQPHDRCRNALLDRFVQDPSWTHLLFVDTDVVVQSDTIDRLLSHAAPIVCAPVPVLHRRYGPPGVSTGVTVGTNIMVFDDPALRGTVVAPDRPDAGYRRLDPDDFPGDVFACDATGLGLCLLERRVVERVSRPWCRFVGQFEGEYIGEDIYFFRQARAAGFDILVDGTLTCDHYKYLDLTHLDLLFTDQPPVSPWPATQRPDESRGVFVAVRVPYTGWVDVRTMDVLRGWEQRLGDQVVVERLFADTVRGGFASLADRVGELDARFTHVLMLGDEVIPHDATLGLLAAVDAPIVSALSRTLIDGGIRWSFWMDDALTGERSAPQNLDLPSLTEPFEVASIDPACVLLRRETLSAVPSVLRLLDQGPHADRVFMSHWCRTVRQQTARLPIQAPLTVERCAEVGLLGLLNLKLRLKAQLRAEMEQRDSISMPPVLAGVA